MELIDRITEDIKSAMFAKDKLKLDALRGIKKELLEAKTAKGSDGTITEEVGIKIMQKMVKQRKESAQIYIEQNRPELAEKELDEFCDKYFANDTEVEIYCKEKHISINEE